MGAKVGGGLKVGWRAHLQIDCAAMDLPKRRVSGLLGSICEQSEDNSQINRRR